MPHHICSGMYGISDGTAKKLRIERTGGLPEFSPKNPVGRAQVANRVTRTVGHSRQAIFDTKTTLQQLYL